MKSKSLKTKIMTAMLTGGILLSSVSLTFAATDKPLNTDKKTPLTNEFRKTKGDLETKLKKLVTNNIITQDQADKIKDVISKDEAARKADFEKIKNMTEEERKTYMASNKVNHINPLKSLVDNKTITQAQADKVGFGGPGARGNRGGNGDLRNDFKQSKGNVEEKLKIAVSSNIITQAESDKIKEAIVKNQTIMKAEFEKIKAMTEEERKTYMADKKLTHINPLQSLVDNGTITQAQADKIGLGGRGFDKHNGLDRDMKGLKDN